MLATALGVEVEECGRLAALPYMLKRGRLRRKFGDEASDALVPLAEVMPLAIQPSAGWLEPLTAVDSIDPGEAQLLAASAERGLLLLTGDKRGLHGVKDIPGYAEALDGHVVVFEAILAELCVQLGAKEIGSRIRPLVGVDIAIGVCFSASNAFPLIGLLSYYEDLSANLGPLTAAHLPDGFLRPAGAGDVTALEEVEGQSAQDQNVGHKHQEGVELPRSIA